MRVVNKPSDDAPFVALIGDLVGSITSTDRAALQQTLTAVLDDVNTLVPAVQPLAPTVGDELQGAYTDLAGAARAALLVRLALLDAGGDARTGLGAATTPLVPDGPAWRAARRALEHAETLAASPRSRSARTWYATDNQGAAGPVNAFLAVRDELVAAMTPREHRLLAHLLRGHPQQLMAEREGVTQPAVSQALARSGATAVLRGHDLLRAHP